MDNQLRTLSNIFTERLFRIPDYQRGYAWTEKQLKDFWNDLDQLDPRHNHYTGVLTLERVPSDKCGRWEDDLWIIDAKRYQPYFVVDGQQRMTTAIILLQALLERIPPGEQLNFTPKMDIQRKFISDSKDGGISHSYIFGYEKDNPSYEFLKTKIFCEESSTATGEETVYTQNLAFAKQFFKERIAGMTMSELECVYSKVTQQLLFNIFTITDEVDVCVAFETMNNRGKALSYLELLKNRLIYLSLKFDEPDFEREKLRREINTCWKAIYHNLGRNKALPLDDDRFLITHHVTYFGKDSEYDSDGDAGPKYRRFVRGEYSSGILERYFVPKNVKSDVPADNRVTLADIYKYVRSLQESVKTWYKMWNPFDSDWDLVTQSLMDKINRLGMNIFHPLLLVFLQSEHSETQRHAFLQALERYLFVMSFTERFPIAGRLGYDIFDSKALLFAIRLRDGKLTSEKVTKLISEMTTQIVKRSEFTDGLVSRFRANGFYQWQQLRYFLFEYNLDLQSRSKTGRPKIFWPEFQEDRDDYVTVEHIFPQFARDPYWSSRFGQFSARQKASLRDSLGNLLPLSKPKNSSLSNRPFPEKVEGKSGSVVGYRYGSYAENEVAKETEWTPQHILRRGLALLAFMERRWLIEIGDEKRKVAMLGLEFVK